MILNIDKALKKKIARNYPKMYWAIDLHDTLFKSTYDPIKKDFDFYNKEEVEFLQFLSVMDECILILFTSSHKQDTDKYLEYLKNNHIHFSYVNENPECQSTEMADFSKKFYFDVLLDDKSGFNPEKDWIKLYNKIEYIERQLGKVKS